MPPIRVASQQPRAAEQLRQRAAQCRELGNVLLPHQILVRFPAGERETGHVKSEPLPCLAQMPLSRHLVDGRSEPSKPGRPVTAERARLAVERAKLAEMKPFRKPTGPATRQSVRRTLRAALNAAISQQLITFNPAAHVELESGKRPKPLLWTEQRVVRWACHRRGALRRHGVDPRAVRCLP